MRYGILGDIHANLEALESVLSEFSTRDIDACVSMGDIVGYGADPAACVARIREMGVAVVAGNHDQAVTGRLSIEYFNPYAREAIYWTQERLSPEDIRYLDELPLTRVIDDMTVVHGTLYNPENFDYLLTSYDAHLSLQRLETKLCFVGHSHVPIAFVQDNTVSFLFDPEIELDRYDKAIVNPGSVGQPRDENPAAAFAIYDTEKRTVTTERVAYDIETATSKILRAGLPEVLAERLWLGK